AGTAAATGAADGTAATHGPTDGETAGSEPADPGAADGEAADTGVPGHEDERERLDPDVEPAEERADVADAFIVADLDAEVRVIDERPRYHLDTCRWVGDRFTLPLPVTEARELGFGPCAVCRPDATLAARQRAARRR
ncbi:MAG TPA: hypothetical protein VGD67_05095, partial [Pseudonocardiaceae bacterium]